MTTPKFTLAQVAAFLDGTEPLDGLWFGEESADGAPYWWRKHLSAAIRALGPDAGEGAVAWLTEVWMQEVGGPGGYWMTEVLPHREDGEGFRNARPLYLHPPAARRGCGDDLIALNADLGFGSPADLVAKDAERMDWLAREFEAHGCITFRRYSVGVAGCELFTVSSQHVRGYGLRAAIDTATQHPAAVVGE